MPSQLFVPVELQREILSFLDTSDGEDLHFLWTTVRYVSTTFKAIVDEMVEQRSREYLLVDVNFGQYALMARRVIIF